MKRILVMGVFILAFYSLAALGWAQTGNVDKPKQWVYKTVTEGGDRLEIVITNGRNGYELTGTLAASRGECDIRGTYFPATGRFKGRCEGGRVGEGIEGTKLPGEDAFKVVAVVGHATGTRHLEFVVTRNGVKRKATNSPSGCGVGRTWNEEESGWTSVWTRQADSDIFEASYRGPNGEKATTRNRVTLNGDQITIQRLSSSERHTCTYTGTIKGNLITGNYKCPGGPWSGERSWKATISCN